MWRNTPTKSRYQRHDINRRTKQHEYQASCNETSAKKMFGARRRNSSEQRMLFESGKCTNKPQMMKVCPECNEKIKEADFAAHLYQHLKNNNSNDYRVKYTCKICKIEFFSRSSKDVHRREKHFDVKARKNIFTTSKVYSDEEEDDDVPLEEEMPNTTTDCQESDYVVQYECQICSEMVTSEYSKKMHRNNMHPLFEGRLFSKKAVRIENQPVPQKKPLQNDGSISRRFSNNMHGQAKATPPSRPATLMKLNKRSESIAKQFNVESESKKTMFRPSSVEYDLDYMCEICKVVFPGDKRKIHRREHPEIDKYEKLFVKIDFPNLGRGKKAYAEHVTKQKRKSNDDCNTSSPAKIQRRRMTCQEKHHNSDESHTNVKPAKLHRRRSTMTKRSSINREESIVKKVTLFECGICKIHFTKSSNIKWHILKGHPSGKSIGKKCQKCGYNFSTDFDFHNEAHHEKSKLSREDFSVLAFDENQFRKKLNAFLAESDEEESSEENSDTEKSSHDESEQRSRSTETTSKTLENQGVEIDVSEEAMNSQSEKPKLFQCADINCSVNFFKVCALKVHISLGLHNATVKSQCNTCQLWFSESMINEHKDNHHCQMNLNRPDDFDILCYSNNDVKSVLVPMSLLRNLNNEKSGKNIDQNTVKSFTFYRCKFCDINYTKEKTMICDKCNLMIILINDVHHNGSDVEKNNFVTIENPPNNIVENVNVIQNEDEHQKSREMEESNKNQDAIDNIDQKNAFVEKNKGKSHIKLYKCFSCHAHFTEISTCKAHIDRHNFFYYFDYMKCIICGLQFEQAELTKHMKIHHAHNLNLHEVEIIEIHPLNNTQYVQTENTVNNSMSSNTDNTPKKRTADKELNAEVHALRREKQNETDGVSESGSRCVSVSTPETAVVHVPNENVMSNTPRIPQRRLRHVSC